MIGCCLVPRIGIACEQRARPELVGAPLALVDSDVVQVASMQANAVGVTPGQPLSAAKLLCPSLIVRPYDREAYLAAAEVVWNVVAEETSFVEPVSPEECLFDLDGVDQARRAVAISQAVANVVSTGVRLALAKSRFVSHNAAVNADDGAVIVITEGQELDSTVSCPLDLFPELDRANLDKLHKLGLTTVGHLVEVGRRRLPKSLQAVALLLIRRAEGLDSSPILPLWPPRSETAKVVFDEEVGDATRIDEALKHAAVDLGQKLLDKQVVSRQMSLIVQYADGTRQAEVEQMSTPAADGLGLLRAARRLLARLAPPQPIIEIVVNAEQIAAPRSMQLSLLDSNPGCGYLPHEREQRLAKGSQFLTRRFGVGTMVTGAALHQARQVNLHTYSLGKTVTGKAQEAMVIVDGMGEPSLIFRADLGTVGVEIVNDVWDETTWEWGHLREHTVYRVLTQRGDLWELHRDGEKWRLCGLAD